MVGKLIRAQSLCHYKGHLAHSPWWRDAGRRTRYRGTPADGLRNRNSKDIVRSERRRGGRRVSGSSVTPRLRTPQPRMRARRDRVVTGPNLALPASGSSRLERKSECVAR